MRPKQKRRDFSDELVELFAELPWWSVPIATVVFFATIAWLLPALFPARTTLDRVSIGHLLEQPSIAGLAAGLLFLAGVAGQVERWRRRRLFASNQGLDAVRRLTWKEFEQWVAEAYRRQGYLVDETAAGADGGVDLVLERGGDKTYVQCKHWRQRQVDVRPVRELFGVMTAGKAQRGVLVTTGTFTGAAHAEAQGKPISLVGGSDLLRLVGDSPEGAATMGSTELGPASVPPDCPRCGRTMVVRQAQRGERPGTLFWGCPRFPACRGTREIQ